MSSLPSSPSPNRLAILKRFRVLYLWWTLIFSGVAIAILAWYWSQGMRYAEGAPYSQTVPLLLLAGALANGISFWFQDQYTRGVLKRPDIAQTFQVRDFAVSFYLLNLLTSVVLSVFGFIPLLMLLFFYWIYPVILWLLPSHLILGVILGREIRQGLKQQR